MEWQPIETAPRDGTRVLAWSARWQAPSTAQWYGNAWMLDSSIGQFVHQPTHWMPLPTPPQQ